MSDAHAMQRALREALPEVDLEWPQWQRLSQAALATLDKMMQSPLPAFGTRFDLFRTLGMNSVVVLLNVRDGGAFAGKLLREFPPTIIRQLYVIGDLPGKSYKEIISSLRGHSYRASVWRMPPEEALDLFKNNSCDLVLDEDVTGIERIYDWLDRLHTSSVFAFAPARVPLPLPRGLTLQTLAHPREDASATQFVIKPSKFKRPEAVSA